MLSRFRNAVFGLPFLSTAANHTYSGPTTSIAIQAAANSSSSTMPSVAPTSAKYETATVANGCFWGTQHIYDKHFKGKLVKTEVGYTVSGLECAMTTTVRPSRPPPSSTIPHPPILDHAFFC